MEIQRTHLSISIYACRYTYTREKTLNYQFLCAFLFYHKHIIFIVMFIRQHLLLSKILCVQCHFEKGCYLRIYLYTNTRQIMQKYVCVCVWCNIIIIKEKRFFSVYDWKTGTNLNGTWNCCRKMVIKVIIKTDWQFISDIDAQICVLDDKCALIP